MPKKTLKQKILSDQRKQTAPAAHFTFSYSNRPKIESPEIHPVDISYIKQDLFKTVFVGSIFLLLEVGLYLFSGRFGW